MKISDYKVIRVKKYSDKLAEQIGDMMPLLSDEGTDRPIPKDHLEAIINSPDTELLTAVKKRDETKVGGVAVINLSRGVLVKGEVRNIKTWLEDFVVVIPRHGIGSLLWEEIIRWSKEKNAKVLNFTSNPSKSNAHKFYQSKPGVEVRAQGATAYFQVDLSKA